MAITELYDKRDNLLKELRSCFDTLQYDLLSNELTDLNCLIIKRKLGGC